MEGRRTPNGGHYHAMPWPSEGTIVAYDLPDQAGDNSVLCQYQVEGEREIRKDSEKGNISPLAALNPADRPMHNDILETVQITPDHLRANGSVTYIFYRNK